MKRFRMIRFSLFLFIYFLVACNSSSSSNTSQENIMMVELMPLSPYHYQFRCEKNSMDCRNDYFFLAHQDWRNKDFRKKIYKKVLQKAEKNRQQFSTYSLYVYEKTEKLNKKFKGDYESLSGAYNTNYISYTRWKEGKIDIFYLIERGDVVYNLLEDKEIRPTWEF